MAACPGRAGFARQREGACGWLSLAAPFLVMQPALGFGVAAAKTANPRRARLLSLLTHTVYGLGLLIAARLLVTFCA